MIDNRLYKAPTNGRQIIEESYDWYVVAGKTAAVYERVLSERRREPFAVFCARFLLSCPQYFYLLFTVIIIILAFKLVGLFFPRAMRQKAKRVPEGGWAFN